MTTNNTLGLDVGGIPGYPPSSTLAPSKPTGWRWPERDADIDKSIPSSLALPLLTLQTNFSTYAGLCSTACLAKCTQKLYLFQIPGQFAYTQGEDEAWNKVRVKEDEQSADQFRNTRLLQRCFDLWKQDHEGVTVSPLAWSQGPRRTTLLNSNPLFSLLRNAGNNNSDLPCAGYVCSSRRHPQMTHCSGTATPGGQKDGLL